MLPLFAPVPPRPGLETSSLPSFRRCMLALPWCYNKLTHQGPQHRVCYNKRPDADREAAANRTMQGQTQRKRDDFSTMLPVNRGDIVNGSLHDDIYAALRQALIIGDLLPGQVFSIRSL